MAVVMPEEAAAMFARNPELLGREGGQEAFSKVKDALSATAAAHKATAKVAPKETSSATSSAPSRPTVDGLNSARRSLDSLAPGRIPGRSGVVSRLIVAFFAGVFVLELVSQMTGQYFKWNLANVKPNALGALNYTGLYSGQVQKLKSQAAPTPAPTYSQTP